MLVLAVTALLLALGDAAIASCSGLLHLAPFVLLLMLLGRRRYLGERYLQPARRPRRRPRRAVRAVLVRAGHDRRVRGGALVGSGMARRPPPLLGLA